MIRLPVHKGFVEDHGAEVAPQVTPQVAPQVKRLLEVMTGEHSRQELQQKLGLSDREYFRKALLQPAIEEGVVELTIPDKPRSRLQSYRLTNKGKAWLKETAE